MRRQQAEREYKAAHKIWLAAMDKDEATFRRADHALKVARTTVVAAELAEPTPKEKKQASENLRNAGRGLEGSRRFG